MAKDELALPPEAHCQACGTKEHRDRVYAFTFIPAGIVISIFLFLTIAGFARVYNNNPQWVQAVTAGKGRTVLGVISGASVISAVMMGLYSSWFLGCAHGCQNNSEDPNTAQSQVQAADGERYPPGSDNSTSGSKHSSIAGTIALIIFIAIVCGGGFYCAMALGAMLRSN